MISRAVVFVRGKVSFTWVRVVLTGILLVYVYRHTHWDELRVVLGKVAVANLGLALCLQTVAIALASVRWQMLLEHQEIRLGAREVFRLTLTSLFFNVFLLGSLGGDAARFLGARQRTLPAKGRLAVSLVHDRMIGLAALLFILTALTIDRRTAVWADRAGRSFIVLVQGGCLAMVLAATVLWLLPQTARLRNWTWRGRNLRLASNFFPKPVILQTLTLSLLIHSLVLASSFQLARAVGVGLNYQEAGILFGLTSISLSLPITVAGIGVRDGVLRWLLELLGIHTPGAAAGLSAGLLGLALLWAAAGAIAFYWPEPRPSRR